MLRLSDPSDLPTDFGPTVVTLGNFDGVHQGHAAVIAELHEQAAKHDAKTVAVTFDPHPLAVLHPDRAPELLTGLEDRLYLLEQRGLDAVVVMPFTRELAAETPREFVEGTFVDALGARAVVVGKDTRFGIKNSGDIDTLRELGQEFGFDVVALDDVGPGVRWSSTQVRELLAAGKVDEAADVLGRHHCVVGEVVKGFQRGRELGFPTANLARDADGVVPADGVYAGWLVRRELPQDHPEYRLPAAISVGTNPTFDIPERTVEAYVLDRDDLELYGERVAIEFVGRLRGNVKFDSIDELIEQMHADVTASRPVLGCS
ncbi:bifunctional riboflavin kinase/FAD synthetase [Dermacoccus abyssi]|uniref:Riboflavin biosynthesis protein n=1 Tax=Dermacoccus abyssi TaxID=322596 RepID=A0ABX5ZAB6_9MICO|nr:bifunctional riboflavin kinase/FAD synthetase [Dermacoccus abyssi]